MDCKEFAITIQCLWDAEVGKDRLDYIIPELLEFLVILELEEEQITLETNGENEK